MATENGVPPVRGEQEAGKKRCVGCGLWNECDECPSAVSIGKVKSQHGKDCPKVLHVGGGYLHDPDDDGIYDVDGVTYCGRCHGWMGSAPVRAEQETGWSLTALSNYFGWGLSENHEIFKFIVKREHLLRLAQSLLETQKSFAATADEAIRERVEVLKGSAPVRAEAAKTERCPKCLTAMDFDPEAGAWRCIECGKHRDEVASPVREAEPKESHEEVAAGVLVAGVRRDSPCGDSRAGDSAARYGEAVGLREAEPLKALVADIVREVAELPDRTSPDDWPEAMLVTADELSAIISAALEGAATGK